MGLASGLRPEWPSGFTVTGVSLHFDATPRISAFYGIVIYMYWKDHTPPHFHAFYGGQESLVRISDGALLRGSLPPTAARLVQE